MSLAKFFWQRCPDQLGSALVANLMLKSMGREADAPGSRYLAEELYKHAGFVGIYLFFLFHNHTTQKREKKTVEQDRQG